MNTRVEYVIWNWAIASVVESTQKLYLSKVEDIVVIHLYNANVKNLKYLIFNVVKYVSGRSHSQHIKHNIPVSGPMV